MFIRCRSIGRCPKRALLPKVGLALGPNTAPRGCSCHAYSEWGGNLPPFHGPLPPSPGTTRGSDGGLCTKELVFGMRLSSLGRRISGREVCWRHKRTDQVRSCHFDHTVPGEHDMHIAEGYTKRHNAKGYKPRYISGIHTCRRTLILFYWSCI